MASKDKASEVVRDFIELLEDDYITEVDVQNSSFVLRAIRDVAFEDRPVPRLRGPKDVRVHIAQTGICGSDVSNHAYHPRRQDLWVLILC